MMNHKNNKFNTDIIKLTYLVCFLQLCSWPSLLAKEPKALFPKRNYAFLEKHCIDCHDEDNQKGEVNLEDLNFHITTIEQAELWQKVLNALNSGEMPPEKKPQPKKREKADFLEDLANTMVVARNVLSDSGGKITMRRLNRREYRNTIQHLLGVNLNVENLPEDDSAGGFDTNGSSQFMSSDQFQQYLKLAEEGLNEMFQRRNNKNKKARSFRLEPEKSINKEISKKVNAFEKDHKNFLAWKKGVERVHDTAENKKIIKKLSLKGVDAKHYHYADKLVGSPDPKKYGFKSSAIASKKESAYQSGFAFYKHFDSLKHNKKGAYLQLGTRMTRIDIKAPWKLNPGNYILRVRTGALEGTPASRHFIEIGHPQTINKLKTGFDNYPISTHQVLGTVNKPQTIEVPLQVTPHTVPTFSIRERQPSNEKQFAKVHMKAALKKNGYGFAPAIWVDWIELEGPLPETPDRGALNKILNMQLVKEYKTEIQKARALLSQFSKMAFRNIQPEESFIDSLIKLFENKRAQGETFEQAIRTPLKVILASPAFIYLKEPGVSKKPRQLTDRELAVRLAYFLWSAPPDAELLELAQRKTLHESSILRKQVDRMIKDPRSNEFVSGFVHQWLDMERLDFFQFDIKLHSKFDESTRTAARREVYASFAHQFRNKGKLTELLNSDYIHINGLLATYYDIEGVRGDEFRKVKLPADSARGGLLGMAAIHAMGSDGKDSSPVERGAWVLRHLLNDPPPPAPANVPQLDRLSGQVLTTRERLKAHQEEPQCASCHRKIDPIGFGLENFDAAGKWRTENMVKVEMNKSQKKAAKKSKKEKKGKKTPKKKVWSIDAAGAFHKGSAFKNYFEMREQITEQKKVFARGFTEALISYSLGRAFAFSDEDLANEILQSAAKKQYSVSEFFHALVTTKEFQSK